MNYVAMLLLICAILSGLLGFGNGDTEVGRVAQVVSMGCAIAFGFALVISRFRRFGLTQDQDES